MLLRALLSCLAVVLCGCGVTQWQREQDALAKMALDVNALHTPEMEKRIKEATQ